METESEPYVRLANLRQLHQVMADMNTARSLADTLQTVADGVIYGLGYELSAVNLVRSDGDLVVAAVGGSSAAEALMTGRTGSRAAWERLLSLGEEWGTLRFIPHTESWVIKGEDIPAWYSDGPEPRFEDEWHPDDWLVAPLYGNGGQGELIGVLSVDRPRGGRRPGAWGREALQMYAFHASIAIANARLRANMQRALVRLEREQQALRASEESFRQAFEYAPSGMAIAEMGGDQHGRLLRVNDALCRLLHRQAAALRRCSFADLVHPEDVGTLLRTSAEGGRAELRLTRRDGSYLWVSLRNSVVADAADGPRFLLTHVEDIEERKGRELQLAHRASHDSLTGLPNSAELRARLAARLCGHPLELEPGPVQALDAAYAHGHGHAAGGPYDMLGAFDGMDGFEGYDGFERHERHGGREVAGYGPGQCPGQGSGQGSGQGPGQGPGFGFPPGAGHGGLAGSMAYAASAGYGYDHHVHVHAPADGRDDGTKGLAVLFCDLDGFKSINDRYGHNAGDAVLIEVARRLSDCVRDGDTVARLGGDEFVVLADGLGRADAEDLAVRLRNEIVQPIRVDGRQTRVGASFGIGWAHCGMTADEVLKSADERMYVEKRSRPKAHRRAG